MYSVPFVKSVCGFLFLLISSSRCKCTLVSSPASIGNTFRECLISTSFNEETGIGHCLGTGLINKLQSLDNEPEFDLIDGVTLSRDSKDSREGFNFADADPSSLRSIFSSFGQIFHRRQSRFDMGFVYPGLSVHITPSPGTAGFLEFALDPHKEALNRHSLKEASTGKLLARQFLVPILLGFRMNVASIIPMVFAVLALIAKKGVLLSKLALIISSTFGLGTLLLGNKAPQNNFGVGHQPVYNGGFGGHHHHHLNRFPEQDYLNDNNLYRKNRLVHPEGSFRTDSGTNGENGNKIDNTESEANDQLVLTGSFQQVFGKNSNHGESSGRNFAWNDDEKLSKNSNS